MVITLNLRDVVRQATAFQVTTQAIVDGGILACRTTPPAGKRPKCRLNRKIATNSPAGKRTAAAPLRPLYPPVPDHGGRAMKRQSNLAFNRESQSSPVYPTSPPDHHAFIQRESNPFNRDAVGIWLTGHAPVLGWLYRKDANRPAVLKKLDRTGEPILCHIEQRDGKKVVVFWL